MMEVAVAMTVLTAPSHVVTVVGAEYGARRLPAADANFDDDFDATRALWHRHAHCDNIRGFETGPGGVLVAVCVTQYRSGMF